ncbi:MAG TPA: hypothetical protein VE684_09835 [Crenalkalicoccus sp.]|jgi:hypothetical protein|nr:hypothetical protein [Crenalkalicoccus sp.]
MHPGLGAERKSLWDGGWGTEWPTGPREEPLQELAAAARIDQGYLGTLLRLTLLAPDIVEAIIDGRPPEGLGLPRLLESSPADWAEQHAALRKMSGVGPAPFERTPLIG